MMTELEAVDRARLDAWASGCLSWTEYVFVFDFYLLRYLGGH